MSPPSQSPDIKYAEQLLERATKESSTITSNELEQVLTSTDPRARRLGLELLCIAPGRIDGEFPAIDKYLEDENSQVRNKAISVFAELLPHYSDHLPDAVPLLIDRLNDEFEPAANDAIVALTAVAYEKPDDVIPAVDQVINSLNSKWPFERKNAVEFLSAIATKYPGEIEPAVPQLVELINDTSGKLVAESDWTPGTQNQWRFQDRSQKERYEYRKIRATASRLVAEVAAAAPDAVRPVTSELRSQLHDDDPNVRGTVIDVFAALGETYPEEILEIRTELVDLLENDPVGLVQGKSAWALTISAETYPYKITEELALSTDSLVDLFDHNRPHVRGAAVSLLSYIAEHHPETVEPTANELIELIDDPHGFVRGNAAWTLGYLDHKDSVDEIRSLENDPEVDVRRTARAVLELLGKDPTNQ